MSTETDQYTALRIRELQAEAARLTTERDDREHEAAELRDAARQSLRRVGVDPSGDTQMLARQLAEMATDFGRAASERDAALAEAAALREALRELAKAYAFNAEATIAKCGAAPAPSAPTPDERDPENDADWPMVDEHREWRRDESNGSWGILVRWRYLFFLNRNGDVESTEDRLPPRPDDIALIRARNEASKRRGPSVTAKDLDPSNNDHWPLRRGLQWKFDAADLWYVVDCERGMEGRCNNGVGYAIGITSGGGLFDRIVARNTLARAAAKEQSDA